MVVAATTGLLSAGAAAAADLQYPVGYTGGIGAFPRAYPSYKARTGQAVADGTLIRAECWTRGEAITNPYGYTTDIWVRSTAGLYWSEAWLDTGSDGVPAGLASCDSAASAPSAPVIANAFFNRSATRAWALRHAMDTPPNMLVPGCTWFASQALWAGGFTEDQEWTAGGGHGTGPRRVDGSVTAWAAPNFVDYLTRHFDVATMPMDFTANAVPQAVIGDIVAYDWDGDATTDHVAVVTDIEPGSYPEVSEWGVGTGPFGSGPAGYSQRGWTYSDKDGHWLQNAHPHVTATLIHFNGGISIDNYDDLTF